MDKVSFVSCSCRSLVQKTQRNRRLRAAEVAEKKPGLGQVRRRYYSAKGVYTMNANTRLVLGSGKIDRIIDNADDLLLDYREDIGYAYLQYHPLTPANKLVPEDLAVTLLVNSRAGYRAFQSLQAYAETINLETLPQKPLERISDNELKAVAEAIATVANWPGFAASMATKVLHKKRPDLVPMLDNQAIFGAYMNPKSAGTTFFAGECQKPEPNRTSIELDKV